jgi:hypothetical protein
MCDASVKFAEYFEETKGNGVEGEFALIIILGRLVNVW